MPRTRKKIALKDKTIRKERWPRIFSNLVPRPLIRPAFPALTPPIINAADDHIPRVKGQPAARGRQRRSGIAENLDLLIRTDEFFRGWQLDPAVAAAGTGSSRRLRHIK